MNYNDIISRDEAAAVIQEQLVQTIFQDVPKTSAFLSLAKKLPNMTSSQTKMRVLDVLPTAYWVNGDADYRQTSTQAWDNVYLHAGELAVIVPIPEAVLADAGYDIVGDITPRIVEAIGAKIDAAVMFGDNRPAEWQNDIVTVAKQCGNFLPAQSGALYSSILGEGGLFSMVEKYGYDVNGVIAGIGTKASLRGQLDSNGRPIFVDSIQGEAKYALCGAPVFFPKNGSFNQGIARMIVGDFSQAVYSIRQDVSVKVVDTGIIQDPASGNITHNLFQQDMFAIRVIFRMGWAIPNPASRLNDRSGCAFAYLEAGQSSAVSYYGAEISVSDNEGAAVSDATVDVNGSRLKTDAGGKAGFSLRSGSYPVRVKKPGYFTASGILNVSDEDAGMDITLSAKN